MIKWIVPPSAMAKRVGYCNDSGSIIVDFGNSGIYAYVAGYEDYGKWLAAKSLSKHFHSVIKTFPYTKLDASDPRIAEKEVADES